LRTKGYEVEGEDGCFVIAFHSPNDAVEFGISLQQNLRKGSLWMPELLALPACRQLYDDKGEVVVIGARVKIGMCTAEAQVSQPSMRTGRAEYFGWVMNHAARVAATANGGQVLLHECSHEALDLNRLRGDIVIKPHGTHRLKGIKSRVSIFEV
jgi:class 3 adenylate cyclase